MKFFFVIIVLINVSLIESESWFGWGDNNKTTTESTKKSLDVTSSSTITTTSSTTTPDYQSTTSYQSTGSDAATLASSSTSITSTTPIPIKTSEQDELAKPMTTTTPSSVYRANDNRPVDDDMDEIDSSGCPTTDSFPELKTLFESDRHSDESVTIAEKTIPIHSFVLKMKSSVLEYELGNMDMGTQLHISDNYRAGRSFIKFFYTERYAIKQDSNLDDIKEVLNLAFKYGVNRLTKLIDDNLYKMLNLNNFGRVFKFATDNRLNKTRQDTWREFVRRHSTEIFTKKLYLVNVYDSYTIESILYSVNWNEKQKTTAIKIISEERRDVDIKRYKRLLNFDECDIEELKTLKDLALIDGDEMWEILVAKFKDLCAVKKKYEVIKSRRDSDCQQWRDQYEDLQHRCQTKLNSHSYPRAHFIPQPYYPSYAPVYGLLPHGSPQVQFEVLQHKHSYPRAQNIPQPNPSYTPVSGVVPQGAPQVPING